MSGKILIFILAFLANFGKNALLMIGSGTSATFWGHVSKFKMTESEKRVSKSGISFFISIMFISINRLKFLKS